MKRKMGMKTIKDKNRTIIVVMQAMTLLLMGVISCALNFSTLTNTLEKRANRPAC